MIFMMIYVMFLKLKIMISESKMREISESVSTPFMVDLVRRVNNEEYKLDIELHWLFEKYKRSDT